MARPDGIRRRPEPPRPSMPCTSTTTRCEFWTWSEDCLRPKCCTEHLVDLAVFTHDLLRRHDILHWIDYGGLLGAVRGGELIPWDGDIDFGCLRSDLDKIAALGPEIAAAGHKLETSDPLVARIYFSEVNLQHADIFLWDEHDDVLDLHAYPGFDWPGMADRRAFPRRFVDHLETVTLNGQPMPAPSPVHEFLSQYRYGPDYMTPARGVFDYELVPDVSAGEMTPVVRELLEELGRGERRLITAEAAHPRPETGFRARSGERGASPGGTAGRGRGGRGRTGQPRRSRTARRRGASPVDRPHTSDGRRARACGRHAVRAAARTPVRQAGAHGEHSAAAPGPRDRTGMTVW